MTITAYTVGCDNRIADKSPYLGQGVTLQGETRDNAVDVAAPNILVTSNAPITCNYVYIPLFGRYYYTTVTVIRAGLYLLQCKSDPVMSFLTDIKRAKCTVRRTYGQGTRGNINVYVPDGDMPMFAYTEDCVHIIGSFKNNWTSGAYVCTVG